MSSALSKESGVLSLAARGAAGGAAALALVAGAEILVRLGSVPALTSPAEDLSRLALAGSALGLLLGGLRRAPRLGAVSPFGIALGTGVALHFWLRGISGSRMLGDSVLLETLRGGLLLAGGAAAGQALGAILRHLPHPRPHLSLDLGLVAALSLPALLPGPTPSPPPEQANLLVLTIDTLRADRLGFAGHPRAVSPHLDRLARRGRTRPRAATPLPRTLPALASLMTGAYPHRHGVRDNFHYSLGPAARTLAEILGKAGWTTAAVNSNPVLSHDSGIYQGFRTAIDRGDDWSRLGILRGVKKLTTLAAMRRGDRARVIADLALDWLRGRPRDQPFLLWVHWLSPHMPYEPAFPFDRVFDPGYEGRFARAIDYGAVSKGEMTYRNPLTARELEHVAALYDGEVATADRAVGRLLRRMELAGDLENTVILFTSDHGESLDEHGYFLNHGDFVYGPAANVPLVLAGPGGTGTVDPGVISLVDVLPTLLPVLPGAAPGPVRADRPPRESRGPRYGESGFCRFPHLNDRLGWLLPREIAQSPERIPDWKARWEEQANRAKQRFVEADGWKLVRTPRQEGDRHELFDLARDPGETEDLALRRPDRVTELARRLDRWMAAGESQATTAEERVLDEETRRALDALGYVGD